LIFRASGKLKILNVIGRKKTMNEREAIERETAKAMHLLARKQMLRLLLNDILIDINICKLEGWDYKDYVAELKGEIDGIGGEL